MTMIGYVNKDIHPLEMGTAIVVLFEGCKSKIGKPLMERKN